MVINTMLPQMMISQIPTRWSAPTGKVKPKKVMLAHKIREPQPPKNTPDENEKNHSI